MQIFGIGNYIQHAAAWIQIFSTTQTVNEAQLANVEWRLQKQFAPLAQCLPSAEITR
jgi:hypothetical protein